MYLLSGRKCIDESGWRCLSEVSAELPTRDPGALFATWSQTEGRKVIAAPSLQFLVEVANHRGVAGLTPRGPARSQATVLAGLGVRPRFAGDWQYTRARPGVAASCRVAVTRRPDLPPAAGDADLMRSDDEADAGRLSIARRDRQDQVGQRRQ